MAWGGVCKPNEMPQVFLGFPDEEIDEFHSDFSVSKIGGLPDWCLPNKTVPKQVCVMCGSVQSLVVQIYAPLANSVYHRTLYIFSCIQPSCWNNSKSWTCLRSQVRDTSSTSETSSTVTTENVTGKATDWLDEADDWGDDNGNQEPVSSSSSHDSPPPRGAQGGHPLSSLKDSTCNNNHDLSLRNLNINATIGSAGDNKSIGYAGGPCVGFETSAEIEQDDDDQGCVSVDIPQIDTSHIPGLFSSNSGDVPTTGVVISPWYIWVGEENNEVVGHTQHEINLLKQLKREGGLESRGDGNGDVYEKTVPRHGDEYTHKLVSTIQKNPGQVLRYCRSSSNKPLLFQPLDDLQLRNCRECGKTCMFELQLLPTLVSYLEAKATGGTAVEFGTVLVYCCVESCWTEGDTFKSEIVIVQQENM